MDVLIACLAAVALAQDLETELEGLRSEEVAVREAATQALRARGEGIVPRLLELHRSTSSAEVRLRVENLLRAHPFAAFSRTGPKEPLRGALREALLDGLKRHAEVAGCWQKAPRLDASRLRIEIQSGSGHGQFLAIDEILSRKEGGLALRRVAYQGTTPYRAEVKEESAGVQTAALEADATAALVELLEAACALRPGCAIEPPRGRAFFSTGSFSMRFRIEANGSEAWAAAYTGYPSSGAEGRYAHGRVIEALIWEALRGSAWTSAEVLPDDRVRALRWMAANFDAEEWWVKERYLDLARRLGDRSYLPFLEKVGAGLSGKDGPSEVRQRESVLRAIERLSK